jgi:S-adenosyl-L-methionine hydrolase (adenosine-forming)
MITLTTDFGTADWFAGTLKGVILGINPRVHIVDITHEVPPGGIRAGAFALAASYRYFPAQTIHLAIVDPGVGSPRKLLVVRTANYVFVGPDNGVLSYAMANEKLKEVHQITEKRLFLQPVSQTFHGRDILAPIAARLSKGISTRKVGPVVSDYVRLDWPRPKKRGTTAVGEIIYIDRFGNALTNIDDAVFSRLHAARCEVSLNVEWRCRIRSSYQEVPIGKPVAVVGSSGFLEIAVNGGSAARSLGLKIGDWITVRQRRR